MQDQGAATGPVAVAAGTGGGLMDGGSLGALFEIRDAIVPEFDAEMDRYAQELIDRFRDLMPAGALDAAGDGLFVDSAPGAVIGLAGRLAINAAVDPAQGGAPCACATASPPRRRATQGFGGVSAGPRRRDVRGAHARGLGLAERRQRRGDDGLRDRLVLRQPRRAQRRGQQAYLTSRQTVLADSEANAIGVDTDSELQTLMLVEQAYAANARVLSVIDELLNILLEM